MTPPPPAKRRFREVIDTTLRGFAVLVICTTIGYLVYAFWVMVGDETLVAGDRVVGAVVLATATVVCLLMLALGLDGWLIGGAIQRSGWTGKLHIALWIAAVHDARRQSDRQLPVGGDHGDHPPSGGGRVRPSQFALRFVPTGAGRSDTGEEAGRSLPLPDRRTVGRTRQIRARQVGARRIGARQIRARQVRRGHVGAWCGVKRLGLIVNPLAGIGGRVGLKGSDGEAIVRQALELGAAREAPGRARLALQRLTSQPVRDRIEIVTWPGEMGESEARAAGFEPTVVGSLAGRPRLHDARGRGARDDRRRHRAGGARPRGRRCRPAALRRRRRHGAQHLQRRRSRRTGDRCPGRGQDPLGGLRQHARGGRRPGRPVPGRPALGRPAARGRGHGHRRRGVSRQPRLGAALRLPAGALRTGARAERKGRRRRRRRRRTRVDRPGDRQPDGARRPLPAGPRDDHSRDRRASSASTRRCSASTP